MRGGSGTYESSGLEQAVDDAPSSAAGSTNHENKLFGGFARHCRPSGANAVELVPLSAAHFKVRISRGERKVLRLSKTLRYVGDT